jgi:hypothetical protein
MDAADVGHESLQQTLGRLSRIDFPGKEAPTAMRASLEPKK